MRKLLLAILIACSMATLGRATNVSLQPTSIPNFNPSNIGGNVVVSGVSVSNTLLTCSACFRPTWVGLGGFTVSISGQDYVVSYIASTGSATLATTTGLTTTTTVTFYPYVEFRIYANQAFQPLGESYVVQPGSPGTGSWYKRYAVSIVPDGAVKVLKIPAITIAATTDSPGPTSQARYTAAFYRPDNSLIQFYNCFEQFAVPPTTPSTWTDLCAFNSPGAVPPPSTEAYTKPQIDARFPSCTAGQMVYYLATGNAQNCLTVGSGLSIAGGVLTAAGGGGSLSGSGTTGYIPKFTGATALGNSIARETSGIFRVDGRSLTSRSTTGVDDLDYTSNTALTLNPGTVTVSDSVSTLLAQTSIQSGNFVNLQGFASAIFDTGDGDVTANGVDSFLSAIGSAGTKAYRGFNADLTLSTSGGTVSYIGYRTAPPVRESGTLASYIGFSNVAPANLTGITSYSAFESTGGRVVFTRKFTGDDVSLKNRMALKFYGPTPDNDKWTAFQLAAEPDANYTYNLPTTNFMVGKILKIGNIAGSAIDLIWSEPTAASGSDTEVQFNNAGSFAGDSRLTYSPTSNTFTVQGAVDFRETSPATPVTLRDGKLLVLENPVGTGSFALAYPGSTAGATVYNWPTALPTNGQILRAASAPVGGTATLEWASVGAGTVTSVGMTVPSELLTVSPSAITSSGTFAIGLGTRTANTIFAGPTTGAAATPTFRSLVAADLPTIGTGTTIGGATISVGSDATGDVYYRSAGGILTRLGIGSAGQVLTVSSGLPAWQAPSSGITLNATNGVIPVKSTSTSFTDSPLSVSSGNVTLTGGIANFKPSLTPSSAITIFNAEVTPAKVVQLGVATSSTGYGGVYLGNITPSDTTHVMISDGLSFTELNAPGGSASLNINAGTSGAGSQIFLGVNGGTTATIDATQLYLAPNASATNALTVVGSCTTGCDATVGAIVASRSNTTTNAVSTSASFDMSSTSTVSAGYGGRLRFGLEASGNANNVNAAAIDWLWTTTTAATPVSNLSFSLVNGSTTYNEAARLTPTTLSLRNGANNRISLRGNSTDYTSGHPGNGQGLMLPRSAGKDFSSGIGIWWSDSAEPGYNGLSGLWINGGMNWQGENGGEVWRFRQPTDTSTTGTSVIEINPGPSDAFISLLPYSANPNGTSSVRFFELTANGGSHVGLKAPDAVDTDVIYTLPLKPGSNDMVLVGSTGGATSPMSWVASSGSGSFVRGIDATITSPTLAPKVVLSAVTAVPIMANITHAQLSGLNNPPVGSFVYCTDCQTSSVSSNVCTGTGTGALAIRMNDGGGTFTWRCFRSQN